MSATHRLRRALRRAIGAPEQPARFFDRHSLDRLLAAPDAELESDARCKCADAPVRCLEPAEAGRPYCRACELLCRPGCDCDATMGHGPCRTHKPATPPAD